MNRRDRYDRDFSPLAGPRYPGYPYTGYPGAWGLTPFWGGMGVGWPAYAPFGPGMPTEPPPTPRRPEESETYGRGGDRAIRRWASRRGYDAGYTIHPRQDVSRGTYDRDYGRGYDRGFGRGYDRGYGWRGGR